MRTRGYSCCAILVLAAACGGACGGDDDVDDGGGNTGPLAVSLPQAHAGAFCASPWVYAQVPVRIVVDGAPDDLSVTFLGTDPMIFLTRVTAPFIFGCILVLNMFQSSLFASRVQPVKGLLNTVAATVIGVALANVYGRLAPVVTGALPSGAPGYEHEIWLANALLSVTFPFLIFFAVYFEFWPMTRATPSAEPRSASQPQQ